MWCYFHVKRGNIYGAACSKKKSGWYGTKSGRMGTGRNPGRWCSGTKNQGSWYGSKSGKQVACGVGALGGKSGKVFREGDWEKIRESFLGGNPGRFSWRKSGKDVQGENLGRQSGRKSGKVTWDKNPGRCQQTKMREIATGLIRVDFLKQTGNHKSTRDVQLSGKIACPLF